MSRLNRNLPTSRQPRGNESSVGHKIKSIASMSFEPKHKVDLDPPKDDIISVDYLSKCDGMLSQAGMVEAPLTSCRIKCGLPNIRSN